MSDRAFAAVFGVVPERLLGTAPPPPSPSPSLNGGHEESPIRISPQLLKEFVRLSVKNHGPTMRDIANNEKVVDDRLMRKLYKSFVKNMDDERVNRLLQKQEKAYSK